MPSHVTSTRASACLASKSTGEARRSCLERGVEVALQILMFTGKQTGCIHSPVMFHRMRTQTPNPAQCLIPGGAYSLLKAKWTKHCNLSSALPQLIAIKGSGTLPMLLVINILKY